MKNNNIVVISIFKSPIHLVLLLMAMVSFSFTVQAKETDWELHSDDGKIQIFTRYLEGKSLRAFKVITTVKADLGQTLMFLNDTSQFPKWVYMIDRGRILQNTDPNGVSYSHMITKIPMIKNRDVVINAKITYDKEKGVVDIVSDAVPEYLPELDKFVRVKESRAAWKITKLPGGRLELILTSHAEPGGYIPKWIANMVVTKLPQYTFERLPKLLEGEETSKLVFDSIQIFGKQVEL